MTRVLLVPGLGLGAECFAPMLAASREAGAPAGAPTTTALVGGYGRRGGRDTSLAPAVLARQVLDRGDLGPASLVVALSAGCQVAAHLALLAPGRVTGLVLIGPTTDPRAATWPRLVRRWVRTARAEPLHQVPALLRQYRRTGLTAMARAMDVARHDRIEETLARVDCPVLVLRGAHDHISPEDWTRSLAQLPGTPDAVASTRRSVTLGGGAHMVPYTHGPAVAGHVDAFAAQLR
ncbi:alpha/beta hydrolase [Nocardioides panacis]|uniref:Alpha/beta hydrolase n=1 Tax=Nocardioides panacis TaxID=2849501 RepID=A0A975T2W6_9ACTN|nr:alpha/beta hydrolase [Nocardioides panacis]QWZ09894.1 alpha/beta hydrolase [Nocardioides panacis]